ncbi:MAG TPA: zinc ribbon domain-containing protein [Methanomassiliicoccales archaeon]
MNCPKCGLEMPDGSSFCGHCGTRLDATIHNVPPGQTGLWFQNFYRIRRKVLTVGNRYFIEDRQGNMIGFSKQKLMRIKDDIRVYSDENMSDELFRIQQENIVDDWGTWAVIDSSSGACVGKMRKSYLSNYAQDEYALLDAFNQQIGRVVEPSGRGIMRKYLPGGGLITEQVKVEYYGRLVAYIQQQFRIIGDTWEVDCQYLPPQFDRRTLLTAMLLMGMVEREEDRR